MTRDQIADIIAPMMADGRTAGSDGVPRVGRATRRKALQIADRLAAALAADVGGWRGMDSAPRDFTPILASAIGADGRQFCAIVYWTQISSMFRSDIRMDLTAPDCEWVGVLGTRYGVPFTHWRPLPEPPPQEPQP